MFRIYNWRTGRYESKYNIPKAKRAQRLARTGAAFLDRARKGWFWDVRVTRLDLSSTCNCILGQVSGDYDDGLDTFGINGGIEAEKLGFLSNDSFKVDYDLLTQAWANEVRVRRGFKPVDITSPYDGRLLVKVAA